MRYNRQGAVHYARRFAHVANPWFRPFPNDCTNFVSQCLWAGGWEMVGPPSVWNYNNDGAWWYSQISDEDIFSGPNRAADGIKDVAKQAYKLAGGFVGATVDPHDRYRASFTWAGADNFKTFLERSGRAERAPVSDLRPGDIIQAAHQGGFIHHSMFVVERMTGPGGVNLVYLQHSGYGGPQGTYRDLIERVRKNQEELVCWRVKG